MDKAELNKITEDLYLEGYIKNGKKLNFLSAYIHKDADKQLNRVKDFMSEDDLLSELTIPFVRAVQSYCTGKNSENHTAKLRTYVEKALDTQINTIIKNYLEETAYNNMFLSRLKNTEQQTYTVCTKKSHLGRYDIIDLDKLKYIFNRAALNKIERRIVYYNMLEDLELRLVSDKLGISIKSVSYYKRTAIKKIKAYYSSIQIFA